MKIFRRLFRTPIIVEKFIGTDEYSNEVYGSPVEYVARQENRIEEGQLDQGEVLFQRSRLFVYGNADINVRDRVTLIDGEIFPVLQRYPHRSIGSQVRYVEVIIGRPPGGV